MQSIDLPGEPLSQYRLDENVLVVQQKHLGGDGLLLAVLCVCRSLGELVTDDGGGAWLLELSRSSKDVSHT